MNLGEKIKKLRTEKGMTQPQLAEALGIEQSYLSKLENDRCIPSSEVFGALINYFSLDISSFLSEVDQSVIFHQLRHIPEISSYINKNESNKLSIIRRWLYASAAACAIGFALVTIGANAWLFPGITYNYHSSGVLLATEPTNIFNEYNSILTNRMLAGDLTSEEMNKEAFNYKNRINEQSISTEDFRGESFVLPVEGGTRFYLFKNKMEEDRFANRYLMIFGTFMAFGGLLGFLVEHRLRSLR